MTTTKKCHENTIVVIDTMLWALVLVAMWVLHPIQIAPRI